MVSEFCSRPDFASFAISVFLISQELDLKLWSHSQNLRNDSWQKSMGSKSRLLPEEGLSSTQDEVSGFVRQP